MKAMPIVKERLHFLTDAPEMVRFLFAEPAVPPQEDIIPKKLDAAKTAAVLEAVQPVIAAMDTMTDEEADAAFRATAEELGVKLGDIMMPIRMAVTGSRVSPPLVGSIRVLGTQRALERIKKTLQERFN